MSKIASSKRLVLQFLLTTEQFQFWVCDLSCDHVIQWSHGFMRTALLPPILSVLSTLPVLGAIGLADKEILNSKFSM